MTTMKLQKLVYYSQAWSLVWDEKPLFEENVETWANGSVVRDLFDYHRGMYEISTMPIGNPRLLNQIQRETVDAAPLGLYFFNVPIFYTDITPLGLKTLHIKTIANPCNLYSPRQPVIQTEI